LNDPENNTVIIRFFYICLGLKQKLWSSGRVLGSQLEGRGIDPHPMFDGSGVKAMPGSIPSPNPGSFNIRKERKYT